MDSNQVVGLFRTNSGQDGLTREQLMIAARPVTNAATLSTLLNIHALMAAGSTETIGKAGSGADNTWNALANIPAGTSWLRVRVRLMATLGGGGGQVEGHVALAASSEAGAVTMDKHALAVSYVAPAAAGDFVLAGEATIPLVDNRFKATWTFSGFASVDFIYLFLLQYG